MRPLAALLGIVMGSAVALFGGLLLTFVVFLLLPEFREELSAEFMPLLQAIAWAALVAAAAVAAFVGEIRHRAWRYGAMLATGVAILGIGWRYWPS
ncbi:MAG: hypothetical protein IPH71_10820 [Proteobacteria bacterium]|nr:hypothetical protein [Pseudomonadota bacterium]